MDMAKAERFISFHRNATKEELDAMYLKLWEDKPELIQALLPLSEEQKMGIGELIKKMELELEERNDEQTDDGQAD